MTASALREIVRAFSGRPFAVVGGGLFDDLPALLRFNRLFARTLFLDQADPELQKAGPWLVALDQAPNAFDVVIELVGDKPTAVFWCCDPGEMVLWRHLRTINVVNIPTWAAEGGTVPPPNTGHENYSPVMFRHWDARVLGPLMPSLESAQFSRFCGPADEVCFACTDYGVRRIIRDESWISAKSGTLTITSQQLSAAIAKRIEVSNKRISRYLREVAPRETAGIDEDGLNALVARSVELGSEMGLTSEQAQGRWAYVMARSQWQERPEFRKFITNGRANPNKNVIALVESVSGSEEVE